METNVYFGQRPTSELTLWVFVYPSVKGSDRSFFGRIYQQLTLAQCTHEHAVHIPVGKERKD